MTRILVATLMRREGGTGVQAHTRTISEYAAAAGHTVSVVTPFDARSPMLGPAFALRLPLRAMSRPAAVWWYRAGHAHYLRAALRARLGYDDAVIYAQCPVSAAVALETGRPVVLAVHFNTSQADEWAGKRELPPAGRLHRSIAAFERRILPRLDGLVYVSEDSRRRVEERVPATAGVPSVVIANAVPDHAGPDHAAPDHGRPAGAAVTGDLITIGSLEPRKNQRYLLDVLAEGRRTGRRWTLTVVGDGPDRGALERRAERLGIAEDVRFLGYRRDARALLDGHRVYVHAAVEESFGIVLVEAMAAGLPVLAGPVGGVPEVVRSGEDGLLWPLDDAATAARMVGSLLDDPARHAAMAKAALRHAAQFRPERLGPPLLAFLDDVAQRSRSAVPTR